MSDVIIKVDNLGKCYRIRHEGKEKYQTIREALSRQWASLWHPPQKKSAGAEDFRALRDVFSRKMLIRE